MIFAFWKAYEELHSILSRYQKTFQPLKNPNYAMLYLE